MSSPVALMLLMAVGGAVSAEEMTMGYIEALERTDPLRIGALEPGSEEERQALATFTEFIADMTPESICEKVQQVYAEDAYFNDTLKELVGAAAIEEYMARSMGATESVRAVVDDVSSSGGDYYVRWTMYIRFKKYNDGQIARSEGISHLRFDADGKIILHRDYWDAAGGLYEHLPVIGGLIRWIKGRL